MHKKLKKLSLKKITILDLDDSSRVYGGLAPLDTTTAEANCSSKPGRDDSCTRCNTNEHTCRVSCLPCT